MKLKSFSKRSKVHSCNLKLNRNYFIFRQLLMNLFHLKLFQWDLFKPFTTQIKILNCLLIFCKVSLDFHSLIHISSSKLVFHKEKIYILVHVCYQNKHLQFSIASNRQLIPKITLQTYRPNNFKQLMHHLSLQTQLVKHYVPNLTYWWLKNKYNPGCIPVIITQVTHRENMCIRAGFNLQNEV